MHMLFVVLHCSMEEGEGLEGVKGLAYAPHFGFCLFVCLFVCMFRFF